VTSLENVALGVSYESIVFRGARYILDPGIGVALSETAGTYSCCEIDHNADRSIIADSVETISADDLIIACMT
jgi:hypothetical protein